MLLSSVGDLILMNYSPLTKHMKGNLFLMGASIFGIAHFFYIATYAIKAYDSDVSINIGTLIALIIAFATMILLFSIAKTKRTVSNKMITFGLLYIAVLSLNMLLVFSYTAKVCGVSYFAALGAFSFFFSDSVIAFNTVLKVKGSLVRELVIWIPYVIGQLLLILCV